MEGFSADCIFYVARDSFFGLNNRPFSPVTALDMFHQALLMPDLSNQLQDEAKYIVKTYKLQELDQGQLHKSVTLCIDTLYKYATCEILPTNYIQIIEDAANSNYSFACALIGSDFKDCFKIRYPIDEYAKRASDMGEPLGIYWHVCNTFTTNNIEDRIAMFKRSAELGLIQGAIQVFDYSWSSYYDKLKNLFYIFELHLLTNIEDLSSMMTVRFNNTISRLFVYEKNIIIVSDIYRAGALFYQFKHSKIYDQLIGSSHYWKIERAIAYYSICSKGTLNAIQAWLIIACRFGIIKDIRKMIASLIWTQRMEWTKLK